MSGIASAGEPRRANLLRPLVRLYPRAWRHRYEAEFTDMLDAQPLSVHLVIDVLFGAVDARVRPQGIVEPPTQRRGADMTASVSGSERAHSSWCIGSGASLTRRDQALGAAVMLGSTVVLALAYVAIHARFGDNAYLDSFAVTPFIAPLILSLPFTYLKGRPALSQAIFIGGSLLLLVAINLVIGFITARM